MSNPRGNATMLEIPPGLQRLIAAGIWPTSSGPSLTEQQIRPSISVDRVRLFAEEESCICFQPPPFPTVAQVRDSECDGVFWKQFGALDQIDPERALVIGDFGLGADSLVILDYAHNAANPSVLRLRWGSRGVGNKWVQGARDFDEFATMLGLEQKLAEISATPNPANRSDTR